MSTKTNHIGAGIANGTGVGSAIEVAANSLAMWIGIGIALVAFFGATIKRKQAGSSSDRTKSSEDE